MLLKAGVCTIILINSVLSLLRVRIKIRTESCIRGIPSYKHVLNMGRKKVFNQFIDCIACIKKYCSSSTSAIANNIATLVFGRQLSPILSWMFFDWDYRGGQSRSDHYYGRFPQCGNEFCRLDARDRLSRHAVRQGDSGRLSGTDVDFRYVPVLFFCGVVIVFSRIELDRIESIHQREKEKTIVVVRLSSFTIFVP